MLFMIYRKIAAYSLFTAVNYLLATRGVKAKRMTEDMKFKPWDWVVFAAMLAVSMVIGIFYAVRETLGKTEATTGEYLMGGRKLGLLPVSISILVSFFSAIVILGNPAEMYTTGTMMFMLTIGMLLSIFLAATIFVPLLYPLQLTSSFEYLELRFNSKVAKLTGTFIMIVQQVLYMGIASFAPSTALEAVTGFPAWATILIVGCVATVYTFLGGMKAVIWTDVFQCVVIVAGLLTICIQGAIKVGGMDRVWEVNEEWKRIYFWDADPDPRTRHSIWTLVVGGGVLWLSAFGMSQPSVQRYCAVSTLNKSRGAVLTNMVGVVIIMSLSCLSGVVVFAYYVQQGCDPLSDKQVSNPNQLLPLFVMEVLGYPGLPGLFMSTLFSGALSSMSSSLNALAAVVWEDILKPCVGHRVSETARTWITKVIVLIFGGAGVGFAFVAMSLGGSVVQASFSFTGAASGPLLGIFLLGGLFPWANWLGCTIGGFVGLAIPIWISFGSYGLPKKPYALEFPTSNCTVLESLVTTTIPPTTTAYQISGVEHLYTLSYMWFASIGVAVSVIVGLIVSAITLPLLGRPEVDSKYLIPIFDRLFCYLPDKILAPLRCGRKYKHPQEILEETLKEKNMEQNGTLVKTTSSHRYTKTQDVNGSDGASVVYSNKVFTDDEMNQI
ncbi:sodium-coupled monocarboxylate transporter 1-like isoform X2 [Mya arenaria]|uniref:sodium-coupled monocarboxylate transporter 1-like isoform X2 n=1 Tax=Mya arenaria TaxID=6604 RepID=UPI0022E70E2B|nr:sodium-coupled monocarboxylate transporter 1-like isoform X2 [Mya arenaria]